MSILMSKEEETSMADEKIEDILSCAICLELLKDPVMLPCLHHFCKKCSSQLPKDKVDGVTGLTCPTCRQLAPNGSIKDNFIMHQLVEHHKKRSGQASSAEPVCGICMQKTPIHHCVDCKCNLCDECKAGHRRIPACKGHTIKEIGKENDESEVIDEVVFCTEHPDKIIEFSCVECSKAICYKCKILMHDKHSTETIESAIGKLKPQVEEKMKPVLEDIGHLRDRIKVIDNAIEMTESTGNQILQKLKEEFDKIMAKLKSDYAVLAEESNMAKASKKKELEIIKEETLNMLAYKESVQQWTNTIMLRLENATLLQQLQNHLLITLDNHQQPRQKSCHDDIKSLSLEFRPRNPDGINGNSVGNLVNPLLQREVCESATINKIEITKEVPLPISNGMGFKEASFCITRQEPRAGGVLQYQDIQDIQDSKKIIL